MKIPIAEQRNIQDPREGLDIIGSCTVEKGDGGSKTVTLNYTRTETYEEDGRKLHRSVTVERVFTGYVEDIPDREDDRILPSDPPYVVAKKKRREADRRFYEKNYKFYPPQVWRWHETFRISDRPIEEPYPDSRMEQEDVNGEIHTAVTRDGVRTFTINRDLPRMSYDDTDRIVTADICFSYNSVSYRSSDALMLFDAKANKFMPTTVRRERI